MNHQNIWDVYSLEYKTSQLDGAIDTNGPWSYPENVLNEQVNKRTIELPQRTCIFKANYCLKVRYVLFELALSISGQGSFNVSIGSKNNSTQEKSPVGCVSPALYPMGGYPWQRPLPLDRDPPDRDPSWTETLTLWTESQTGVKTLPSRNFVCGR